MTLYSQRQAALLPTQLEGLVEGAQVSFAEAAGRITRCRCAWPDLQITINAMDADQIPGHLAGFERYARQLAAGRRAEADPVFQRIRSTRMVLGFVVSPEFDDEDARMERLEDLLLSLCERTGALLFWRGDLYDCEAQPLIPDLAGDTDDKPETDEDDVDDEAFFRIALPPADFEPTAAQIARFERSRALLDAKRIPRLPGPLYTHDDAEVTLRSGAEAARRLLVLWVVALYGEEMPQAEAWALLDRWQLRAEVSPEEERMLREGAPDPEEMEALVWRLEAVWTLLWCLGRLDDLGWPASMCDVPRQVELMRSIEADPAAFITNARLRPLPEILDAADLTMRLHWTTRDAWINGRPIRSDLDWTQGEPDIPVAQCPATGVLEQRHKTLNWLTRFTDAGWDHVDTPT